jgi:hypothetical protein
VRHCTSHLELRNITTFAKASSLRHPYSIHLLLETCKASRKTCHHSYKADLGSNSVGSVASRISASPALAATLNSSSPSARILPTLIAANGLPCSAMLSTCLKTERVETLVPTISAESHSAASSVACCTILGGTEPPKKTTAGFKMPLHEGHAGMLKFSPASTNSMSPSGLRTGMCSSSSCTVWQAQMYLHDRKPDAHQQDLMHFVSILQQSRRHLATVDQCSAAVTMEQTWQ